MQVTFQLVMVPLVCQDVTIYYSHRNAKSHSVRSVGVLSGSWEWQSVVIVEAGWWVYGGSLSHSL